MKAIYISGASHSGSTTLGSCLGSDPVPDGPFKNFHIGEAHQFFNPKSSKFNDQKAANDFEFGNFWNKVNAEKGYICAYDEINNAAINVDKLIDSSKSVARLRELIENGVAEKFDLKVVVVYRPFKLIASSFKKRGISEDKCVRSLKHYHRLFNLMDKNNVPYLTVNTESFFRCPHEATKKLCMDLGIDYFQGKENYWNYPTAHLYGARTTRLHFKEPGKAGFIATTTDVDIESYCSEFLKSEEAVRIERRLNSESIIF